jgi:hypothetical protein
MEKETRYYAKRSKQEMTGGKRPMEVCLEQRHFGVQMESILTLMQKAQE